MNKSYYGFSRNSVPNSKAKEESIREKELDTKRSSTTNPIVTYYAATKVYSRPVYRKRAKEIGKL